MKNLQIISAESFGDYAGLRELNNNACASLDEKFLQGYQVDVLVKVTNSKNENREFNISFQSEEMTNGMMAYSNYGMETSASYGNDGDDSGMLESWLEETEEYDFFQIIINECYDHVKHLAKEKYEELLVEEEK